MILDKLRSMRLYGMYECFKSSLEQHRSEDMTIDEFLSLMIDSEWDDRHNRSIERLVKSASFRYKASVENINYSVDRGLDRTQIERLAQMDFVREHKDIFITGSTGTGKSYIASALGHQGCCDGLRVLYANTAKLMATLKIAKAKGTILLELKRIERLDLLILDDFGLQPFDATTRTILLDIIEDRHGKSSTIISSQIPVQGWYDVIGEGTLADAVLDRIVHKAIRIELYGESLRTCSRFIIFVL